VTALRSSPNGWWDWVAYARTDGNGTYDLGGLPTGQSYKLQFRDDDNGDYVTQYYNKQPRFDSGWEIDVPAPGEYSGYDAELVLAGHITGTVTKEGGVGLGEISVNAYASLDDYNNGNQLANTQTDGNGDYDLGGLPAEYHRLHRRVPRRQ